MTLSDCCIFVVWKIHALTGNFGGAKMYFGAGAVRTAAEALRVLGETYCLVRSRSQYPIKEWTKDFISM